MTAGDFAIFAVVLGGLAAFAWCAFAVSGAHAERERDEDVEALRRGDGLAEMEREFLE